MFPRSLNISKSQSFFLFGARGTGKSTFLEGFIPQEDKVVIDLLDPELADELISYPNNLEKRLAPHIGKKTWVVIDEVQKAPQLLDLVHKLIREKKFKFALTGSSARKLKRGAANLLAGRAFVYNLFPLTEVELGGAFSLEDILMFGSLPLVFSLFDRSDKAAFLKAYAQTFIKEEILSEQIVRNLPPFRRFLDVAAQTDGNILNYSNVAKDINSDPKTVSGYYDILEDTLLGFRLPAYHTSIRKQQKKAPKFYLFDTGVSRALAGRVDAALTPKTFEYGQLFESLVINEIHRRLEYSNKQYKLSFLRVNENLKIDLIVEKANCSPILLEIKSTDKTDERHAKGLLTLGGDFKNAIKILASKDPTPKSFSDVLACHWIEAINRVLALCDDTTS